MTADDRPEIQIRLLGPVEAHRGATPLAIGGPRQRALLALLAIEAGRAVSVDRLVDELWAGAPPDGAETTVRSYVSRLRTALGPGVAFRGSVDGYRLDIDPDRIDLRRFEARIRAADDAFARRRIRHARTLLAEALGLWSGRPFGELGVDGILHDEAERLAGLRLHALERGFEADLELGLADVLVDELEAAVREHPFRERLWRHLMLALYRAGRQADALAAYQRARDQLDEQLGISPGEDLEALQLQVLRQEVPAAQVATIRHNLPNPLTSFVGRRADLDRVVDQVRRHRLVVLTGVGGVGKTRLALEAARRLLDEHPDGTWFVDLAPLSDPELVPGHVGSVLELREQASIDPIERLVAGLKDRELLLVLDNCEHVREASAGLAQRLLAGVPGLRILATSREALGVPGEVDAPVPPLAVPAALDDVEAVRSSEAVRLLFERIRAVRPGIAESDEAFRTAAQICKDLDGLPLAIELAAARARALSLVDIANRLADRFRFLVSWRRLTTARHRTLREAMDWSFDLLTEEERSMVGRLSVFAGSFDLPAVAAVCAGGDDEVALRIIERLVDASLVVPVDAPTGLRYRLLETVRQYAADHLDARDRIERQRAHVDHFLEVASLAKVRGAGQAAAMAHLDREIGNLRAALDYAHDLEDPTPAVRLTVAVWRFWFIRGHLAEGRARIDGLLSRVAGRPVAESADLLYASGYFALFVGEYPLAREIGQNLLTIARSSGSVVLEHDAAKLLGLVSGRQDDLDAAWTFTQRALELARELGDDFLIGRAQLNSAVLAMETGPIEDAVPMFEEGLERFQRSGDAEEVGFASINLGEALYRLGRHGQASQPFELAAEAFGSIGFRANAGQAVRFLACVAAREGRFLESARLFGKSDAIIGDVGQSWDEHGPAIWREGEELARAGLGDVEFRTAVEEGRRAELGH